MFRACLFIMLYYTNVCLTAMEMNNLWETVVNVALAIVWVMWHLHLVWKGFYTLTLCTHMCTKLNCSSVSLLISGSIFDNNQSYFGFSPVINVKNTITVIMNTHNTYKAVQFIHSNRCTQWCDRKKDHAVSDNTDGICQGHVCVHEAATFKARDALSSPSAAINWKNKWRRETLRGSIANADCT